MNENRIYSSEKASSPLEVRVVAFVDVLGFRALMQKLQADDPGGLQTVRKVLEWIDEQKDFLALQKCPGFPAGPHLEISQFSDCLILSGPSIAAAADVVASVAGLAHVLLLNGLLSRGAVVLGEAYHKGGVAFGPAVIDAYDVESKVARYPRIIVSNEVRDTGDPTIKPWLRKDEDHHWFIDLYSFGWSGGVPNLPPFQRPISTFLRLRPHNISMMERIRNTLYTEYTNEWGKKNRRSDVLEKLEWAVSQFNDALVRLAVPCVQKIDCIEDAEPASPADG